jgi:hypothetical protein
MGGKRKNTKGSKRKLPAEVLPPPIPQNAFQLFFKYAQRTWPKELAALAAPSGGGGGGGAAAAADGAAAVHLTAASEWVISHWRSLSTDERTPFEEASAQQHRAFEEFQGLDGGSKACAAGTSSTRIAAVTKKADGDGTPAKPKQVKPFYLFNREWRDTHPAEVVEARKSGGAAAVRTRVSTQWHDMDADAKTVYKRRAKALMAEHTAAHGTVRGVVKQVANMEAMPSMRKVKAATAAAAKKQRRKTATLPRKDAESTSEFGQTHNLVAASDTATT